MVDRFQLSAEAVGATIKRFSTVSDALGYLGEIAQGGLITASLLPEQLQRACESLITDTADPAAAELCISRAEAGIAATGSLLIDLRSPDGRAATALAPKHAVFLDPAALVPTIHDLRGRLENLLGNGGQAYFSLTTGPSRTADIERVLTIGVHGPKELHILLVEGA